MSVETSTTDFALEVGKDVKSIFTLITGASSIASLTNLETNTKANLVASINEVLSIAKAASGSGAGAAINDDVTSSASTWSSTKIDAAINVVASQVQTILAASPEAFNTFKEVSDYIASDKSGADAMLASIQNRIRVDESQTFTAGQITQGLANLVKLGVAKQTDLNDLKVAIGDTTINYKNVYLQAKNS